MKDQKVLFIKGFDQEKDEKQIREFLAKVFSKLKIDTQVKSLEMNKIYEVYQAVVYLDQSVDLVPIIELLNEKEFEGNSLKLKVQKFLTKQERIKEQTEKEKRKPLNVLYL